VQSGVGRTGKWWGHEHFFGVRPDIMLFAKGIASGFPFAGLATRDHLFEVWPRTLQAGGIQGAAGGASLCSHLVSTHN
jgi:4-aminobutyrate aminotransferase